MIRYLASVGGDGYIDCAIRHIGPVPSNDESIEIPESAYQAYLAGMLVRLNGDRIETSERPIGYAHHRRMAYPPLTDLADALYWQSRGNEAPITEYLRKIDDVKRAHPKTGGVK